MMNPVTTFHHEQIILKHVQFYISMKTITITCLEDMQAFLILMKEPICNLQNSV
jgi:hypothetical protein